MRVTYGGGVVCKIGVSKDVKTRKKLLQTGCPFPIGKTWCSRNIPDYKQCESLLHHEFNKYRTKGEWFSIDFIKASVKADEICKNGFERWTKNQIENIETNMKVLQKEYSEIEQELKFIKYECKGYVG